MEENTSRYRDAITRRDFGLPGLELAFEDDDLELRCECGERECEGPVTWTPAQYEILRAYPGRFLVAAGHEHGARASSVGDGWAVVEPDGAVDDGPRDAEAQQRQVESLEPRDRSRFDRIARQVREADARLDNGELTAARLRYFDAAVEFARLLGGGNLMTLTALQDLAATYQGSPREALARLHLLQPEFEAAAGADDPFVLKVRADIGCLTAMAGEPDEGHGLLLAVVRDCERVVAGGTRDPGKVAEVLAEARANAEVAAADAASSSSSPAPP